MSYDNFHFEQLNCGIVYWYIRGPRPLKRFKFKIFVNIYIFFFCYRYIYIYWPIYRCVRIYIILPNFPSLTAVAHLWAVVTRTMMKGRIRNILVAPVKFLRVITLDGRLVGGYKNIIISIMKNVFFFYFTKKSTVIANRMWFFFF